MDICTGFTTKDDTTKRTYEMYTVFLYSWFFATVNFFFVKSFNKPINLLYPRQDLILPWDRHFWRVLDCLFSLIFCGLPSMANKSKLLERDCKRYFKRLSRQRGQCPIHNVTLLTLDCLYPMTLANILQFS